MIAHCAIMKREYFANEKERGDQMMSNEQSKSLRHIKREATANKLADAAFELALEKGLDGFVVEDIVRQAGYSRRTFSNYYSCKEEAVVGVALNFSGASKVEQLIENVDDTVPLIDILYQLMEMQFTAHLLKKVRQLVKLSEQYPTLNPYVLSVLQRYQLEAVKIMMKFSKGRYSKEYPHLLVGAVYGAIIPLLDGTLIVQFPEKLNNEKNNVMTFQQFLEMTFNYLRDGFK